MSTAPLPTNTTSYFAMRPARRSQKLSSTLTAIAFAVGIPLMTSEAYAQQRTAEAVGPFGGLAGTWSGSGLITMKEGAHERIRCRGT
jgi:hypothetical protein